MRLVSDCSERKEKDNGCIDRVFNRVDYRRIRGGGGWLSHDGTHDGKRKQPGQV